MPSNAQELWTRYCDHLVADRELGISVDVSRVRFDDNYLDSMTAQMSQAMDAMEALERGSIANLDEQRMVGHYWLRAPERAPSQEIVNAITTMRGSVREFARNIHGDTLVGQGGPFRHLLHIGIGGSALGPQLLADALGGPGDRMQIRFIDNTDPDGIDRVLHGLGGALGQTLVTVVSKSGGTPEPANAMIEVQAAYRRAGLDHAPHFVAVTGAGSRLDETAAAEGWLQRFPIWDWVGGRTSVMSAVGLVPAALQGIDIEALLAGADAMDGLTRRRELHRNPAALLALMWHRLGDGRGAKDMVVLPYKDRLLLLSRYLQQLVMESLGKEFDRAGATVNQGIAVYGNKGSTDQHAYVQQLREGVLNFFVTFIQVLSDRDGASVEVRPGITAGDYLCGFLQGTRQALYDNDRESITITIERVSPRSIGALIALYERAVGLYAELIDVNAYHQPGVEAGKKVAAAVLSLQEKSVAHLASVPEPQTAEQVAEAVGQPQEMETVFKVLEHLAVNGRGIAMEADDSPRETVFRYTARPPGT
jgi:glucose-6-phosphate isomerase